MDVFLRSIGFNKAKRSQQIEELKADVLENPDKRVVLGSEDDTVFVEYYKMYGNNIGIIIRGSMDGNEAVVIDSCEAYAVADYDSLANRFLVEYVNNEPVIVFEDIDTGNELVFSLQNRIDLYKDEMYFINYGRSIDYSNKKGLVRRKINYAALSIHGSVILPIEKAQVEEEAQKEEESYYKSLVLRYREGDNEAEEILKIYAEQTSSIIRERLKEEDFLSVVEGYFLPMEDNDMDYSVLGEIMAAESVMNTMTKEKIYKLTINVTGTSFQLFINKRDIMGLPMVGMRFMGTCKLQGSIIITE